MAYEKYLKDRIEDYAEMIVKCGLNVQPGQEVVIAAPVECAEFARVAVAKAYAAGAGAVHMRWRDDAIARMGYENKPLSAFEEFPPWDKVFMDEAAKRGAAYLSVSSEDPDWACGLDQAKIKAAKLSSHDACEKFYDKMDFGHIQWCIAGVPSRAWAMKALPNLSKRYRPECAEEMLWNAILDVSRVPITGGGAVAAWREHEREIEARRDQLNGIRIKELHYENSIGIDLTLSLPEGAVWHGGSSETSGGVRFSPNIPTEEVYCSPDFRTVNGVVHSTLPLIWNGQEIDGFWIRFEDGVAVEWDAETGKEALDTIIGMDEGSCRLGEAALVPFDSPIRNSGILFYDTLYDENASCHLALGASFPECVEGGLEKSKDELLELGLNDSKMHVDFMIGTADLKITATTADGDEFLLFDDGNWAI